MIIDNKEYKVFDINDESLGLAKSQELKQIIENDLKSGINNIAFDFNKLNSINSAGLGILIGILNKIKLSNGSLRLMNINDRIMNIFKITKLDQIFEISS